MIKIQILGSGCPKCEALAKVSDEAASELDMEYKIEKITEITEIIKFGVLMTPALVVDGDVKMAGKVPSIGELKTLLTQ